MSEHKNKSVVAAKSSGIVIGDGRHHYNFHLRVVGLILVGVAVVVLLFLSISSLARHLTNSKAKSAKPLTTHGVVLTPTQKAEYLMAQGNYAEAQKIFNNQLSAATNKKAQADAYGSKAIIAFASKDYASARTYEAKADGLDPTADSAEYLGDIASMQGDKASAAGYYQVALSRLNKQSPTYGYVANKIQAKLNGAQQ